MHIGDILRDNLIKKLESRTVYIDDCWCYRGVLTSEYPSIRVGNGRQIAVHRVSASLYLDLDLDDKSLQANHLAICKHKNCWNPKHLYIGTQADNMEDKSKLPCEICNGPRLHSYFSTYYNRTIHYCAKCKNRNR